MRSLCATNLVLVALVLVPTGVLAGLSLSAVDAYRAEADARMRQELDEMEATVTEVVTRLADEDAAAVRARLAEATELVIRRLPDEPAHRVFADVRARMRGISSLEGGWRVRVIDAQGRTVVPARFDPEAVREHGSDRERLLEDLRQKADAALFGVGSVEDAGRVWTEARARFSDDALKAVADVEGAWVAFRASREPERARSALSFLSSLWRSEVLDGVGRTWVLLVLAAAGPGSTASGVLERLAARGSLDAVPLTDEERERVERARLGRLPYEVVSEDVWTAPLPAGLGLELRRLWPISEEDLAESMSMGVRARWPATRARPHLVVPRWKPGREVPPEERDRARLVQMPVWGSGSAAVLLVHPEAELVGSRVAARKRWAIAGVAALLVLVGLGLHLTLRALRREREARRLKDDFLANVSHELRTPLTSVCLHADLLAEGPLPDAQRRSHAEVVRAEGARLSALVDDLLDFAARERGARRLEPAPVDVGRAVARAVEPFRVLAEREGVALSVETGDAEVSAMADPLALERILANLLGNAWKHGRPSRDGAPGRIRVTATETRAGAEVTVRDDGPGIPATERGALFERFHRGAAAAAKTRGVGLGLALSRDLARAMGGDLVVVEDPNETVFRLTLPPVPPPPPDEARGAVP